MSNSNAYTTGSNPLRQGGWRVVSPAGSASPQSSQSSHSSTSGNSSDWTPLQTSYGVLPLTTTPGAMPGNLQIPGAQVGFRFRADGSTDRLLFVGPNNIPTFYISSGASVTTITSNQSELLARLEWPTGAQAGPPVITFPTQGRIHASRFLSAIPGNDRVRVMTLNQVQYAFSADNTRFFFRSSQAPLLTMGYVERHSGGTEIRVNQDALMQAGQQFLLHLVVAVVVLQSRNFVGL